MTVKLVTRRRKSGTWKAYQADAGLDLLTGKRRRRFFQKRGEALEWLRKAESEKTVIAPDSKKTIEWLGKRYVQNRKDVGRERSTWRKYEQQFDKHICPMAIDVNGREILFGNIRMTEIRPAYLAAFKDKLIKRVSYSMALRIRATLAAALDYAVANEWCASNPLRSIKIDRRNREEAERITIPNKAEIASILTTLSEGDKERPTFGITFIYLLLTTGLRPSEARALTEDQLDLSTVSIRVDRRVDEWNQLGKPKSASGIRDISLPASLLSMLRRWLLVRPKNNPDRLIFPTSAGSYYLHSNIVNRIWKPFLIAANLFDYNDKQSPVGRYRLYDLRHCYASMQIDQGLDPKTLQHRMGHSSIKVTLDLYGHLFKDRDRDKTDMDRLDQYLDKLRHKA